MTLKDKLETCGILAHAREVALNYLAKHQVKQSIEHATCENKSDEEYVKGLVQAKVFEAIQDDPGFTKPRYSLEQMERIFNRIPTKEKINERI